MIIQREGWGLRRCYPGAPLVGVGAVVFRGSEALLVRRGSEPARGIWTLPGGLLELGETLKEGVRREVAEECGIRVEVGELLGAFERIVRDEEGRVEYHYVILDYLATWLEGNAVAASDVMDARWVPLSGLGEYDVSQEAKGVIFRGWKLAYGAWDDSLEDEADE